MCWSAYSSTDVLLLFLIRQNRREGQTKFLEGFLIQFPMAIVVSLCCQFTVKLGLSTTDSSSDTSEVVVAAKYTIHAQTEYTSRHKLVIQHISFMPLSTTF